MHMVAAPDFPDSDNYIYIYTDNYYSSPDLFGDLQHLGFCAYMAQ